MGAIVNGTRRIKRLLDHSSIEMATFSLSRVPGKTRWDNAWTPSALVYGGCPVMIRAIGNVREVQKVEDQYVSPTNSM